MKRKFGIKGKLLLSFIIFSAIVIVLLWVLEVVFLDEVYRSTKIHTLRSAAEKIQGMKDDDYGDFVLKNAVSSGLCIKIYDENLNFLVGEHAGGQCVIHSIGRNAAERFYETTEKCEGQSFETYLSADEVENVLKNNRVPDDFFRDFFGFENGDEPSAASFGTANDCVLISRIITNREGEMRYVLLSTVIVPVESTVVTIRLELMIVSVALILVSLLMAYFLSKNISAPLISLNRASKTLSEGKFDGSNVYGYREVEELSQTLSHAANEISQVDRLRRELIANVSHDLRTPLTLISGYSEAMRDLPGENTSENLQIIIDETHRLSELVSDLLDLSKMEAGMDRLQTEQLELVSFVREICRRYDKMTGFQGYRLDLICSEEAIRISADPNKLRQVVYNLINNAILYCGEDRYVCVRVGVLDGYALVEVIDRGGGIPADRIKEIWDRYYRVDQNHKSAPVGTGLGLSIVKKILDLHGARFGVESEEGKGSRFWFAFPLEPSEE